MNPVFFQKLIWRDGKQIQKNPIDLRGSSEELFIVFAGEWFHDGPKFIKLDEPRSESFISVAE